MGLSPKPMPKMETEELIPRDLVAYARQPLDWDYVIYRIAVSMLGILALSALGGLIALALKGKQSPEGLVALGSAAVGALAGLVAPGGGR